MIMRILKLPLGYYDCTIMTPSNNPMLYSGGPVSPASGENDTELVCRLIIHLHLGETLHCLHAQMQVYKWRNHSGYGPADELSESRLTGVPQDQHHFCFFHCKFGWPERVYPSVHCPGHTRIAESVRHQVPTSHTKLGPVTFKRVAG
jgi:hypothetical protein